MAFEDDISLDCELTVKAPDGSTFTIEFPCGSVFDPKITGGGSSTQIPLKYQIMRERAILKPCCWWQETEVDPNDLEDSDIDGLSRSLPETFSYVPISGSLDGPLGSLGEYSMGGWSHEATPSFSIEPFTFATTILVGSSVPTKCLHPGATTWHQGADNSPPCNGAKTECPFYTGPKFQYIKDEHLRPGQPIVGEQVQELRSLIRDWTLVPNAEEVWEQLYESPFIWGYDQDNQPLVINQPVLPDEIQEADAKITNLVRVKWLTETEEIEQSVFPSTPGDPNSTGSDTSLENPDGIYTPPKFFTIIGNLSGSIRPPLEITFPPANTDQGTLFEAGFTFDSMTNSDHTMYLSGTTLPSSNVYIVNTSLVSFPMTQSNIPEDVVITEAVLGLVETKGVQGVATGFRVVTSDTARFWQVLDGIDLVPNQTNDIIVMVRSGNNWNPIFFQVHYNAHQFDLVQQGHEGLLPLPQTQTLVNSWSNLTTQGSLNFNLIGIAGGVSISKAYHYYVYDRSFSRLIAGEGVSKPDRRYWKVTKESFEIAGTGEVDSEQLRWSLLDNCNTFLIEVLAPKPTAARPAGIDRGWEPRKIVLESQPESASGHGEKKAVEIELEVVGEVGEVGRSIDGSLFPTRFIMVRPVGDQSIGTPSKLSTMRMELDIFEAFDVEEEGDDAFEELYEEFPEQISSTAGGVKINGIGDDVVLATSAAHSVSISNSQVSISASKFDVSYMVEVKANSGEVLGRKWIYGVSELASLWVRDVDIKYAWSSIESSQVLTPNYSRATSQLNKPEKTFESGSGESSSGNLVTYVPRCGDHEGHWLFSPYGQCDQAELRVNDGGILLNQEIATGVKQDERYRGPAEQLPFSFVHNLAAVISKCVFEWTFGTKTRLQPTWSGLARTRGPISEILNTFLYSQFKVQGWALPAFGNKGREHVRVYRTMHYREYVYNTASGPKVAAGWMPAVPFIGSTGVFDDTKPRTFFDYSAETASLPAVDYRTFAGQESALAVAVSEPAPSIVNQEVLEFKRYTYEQAFKVRRPGIIGEGIQWPPEGWYLNPRDPTYLWAFPEPVTDIARDFDGSVITGLNLRKPQPEGEQLLFDRFNRPIDVGPLEGRIPLRFVPTEFDSEGVITEYAKVFIDEQFPSFFDMETGEIKDSDLEGNPTIATGLTPQEVVDLLVELELAEVEIVPVYSPVSVAEELELPESLEDLTEVQFYGNIASDMTRCYVYAVNGGSGNSLDDDEIIWKGFFRTLELTSVDVELLPTEQFVIEEVQAAQAAVAVFSNFPSTIETTRAVFSGKPQNAFAGFHNSPMLSQSISRNFSWEPYSDADLLLPDPSLGSGSLGAISNVVTLPNNLTVVSIGFSYEVVPRITGTVFGSPTAGPFTDPQVLLKLVGAVDVVLLEKPRIRLLGDGNKVVREFLFDINDLDPFETSKIVLEIGARDDATGIRISSFQVKVNQIVPASEEILVLNPKVLLSTGYGTSEDGEGLYLPSQKLHLSAVTTTPDQPDTVEVSNIAELWQPGMASTDATTEVGTVGKIRRHWASPFSSYDTAKYLGNSEVSEHVFADQSVTITEARQQVLIDSLYDKIEELPNFAENELQYFLLPQDRFTLSSSFASNNIKMKLIRLETDSVIVSETTLEPGWQPKGWYACIPDTSQSVVQCIVNLGVLGLGGGSRTAHSVYGSNSHDTCSGDGEGGRSAYSLFEFGRITEKIIGFLATSAGALVGQADAGALDSLTDLFGNRVSSDRIAASLESRIQAQLNNLGRYRP